MMDFKELLIRAQRGEKNAQEELLKMYQSLIMKESIVENVFDEDLYQELCYCRGRPHPYLPLPQRCSKLNP